MNTELKDYTFTEIEVIVLRNATYELFHQLKGIKPASPLAQKAFDTLKGLKEQFKQDVELWK
jgi:hypothetical protein